MSKLYKIRLIADIETIQDQEPEEPPEDGSPYYFHGSEYIILKPEALAIDPNKPLDIGKTHEATYLDNLFDYEFYIKKLPKEGTMFYTNCITYTDGGTFGSSGYWKMDMLYSSIDEAEKNCKIYHMTTKLNSRSWRKEEPEIPDEVIEFITKYRHLKKIKDKKTIWDNHQYMFPWIGYFSDLTNIQTVALPVKYIKDYD